MTATIELAEKALSVRTGLKKKLDPLQASIAGRPVAHWSYKVMAAGTIVGLIAALAFSILGMTPAAIIGGVLTATNAFGAFFLHRFRLYDQLEQYVKEMANRINLFGDRIKELKEANKNLAGLDKKLEVIPRQWEEKIEEGKKELEGVHKKFGDLKKQYNALVQKLEKLSDLSKSLKEGTTSFAHETVKYQGTNTLLEENIKRIHEELEGIEKHNHHYAEHNKELDEANHELERIGKEIKDTLTLFISVKDIYEKSRELTATFDQKVADFSAHVPNQAEIGELNKQIINLKDKVEILLKKETELKELRAFKDANKVTFEAWRKTRGK